MKFTKMHGLGNDYLFINGFEERIARPGRLSMRMSHRHCGVGSDGIILILPSARADFRMRIFNADGSEAETCGNGLRCLAKYVYEHGLIGKREFQVETLAGLSTQRLSIRKGKVVSISSSLGIPRLDRKEIPMKGPAGQVIRESLKVAGRSYRITALSMGNPHVVLFVPNVDRAPLVELGPKIEKHPKFPRRTNVEFVQVLDRKNIRMRIWERGSGETLASGSGSSASAVAAALNGFTERKVRVHVTLGVITVHWTKEGEVWMSGPATEVFSGEWN